MLEYCLCILEAYGKFYVPQYQGHLYKISTFKKKNLIEMLGSVSETRNEIITKKYQKAGLKNH